MPKTPERISSSSCIGRRGDPDLGALVPPLLLPTASAKPEECGPEKEKQPIETGPEDVATEIPADDDLDVSVFMLRPKTLP